MLLMAVVHFGGAKAPDVPAAASRQEMSKGRVILIVIIWIHPISNAISTDLSSVLC